MPIHDSIVNIIERGGFTTVGNVLGLWGRAIPPDPNATTHGIGALTSVNTSLQYGSYPFGATGGTTGDWTQDSSSNLLTLSAGSTIREAHLFYSAVCRTADQDVTSSINSPIDFTPPGASSPISITPVDIFFDSDATTNDRYHCHINVTAYMNGAGYYTIGRVPFALGKNFDLSTESVKGGWTIVVLYRNDTEPARNLRLWNDYFQVYSGTYDVLLDNLTTSSSGPVNVKLFLSASGGTAYRAGGDYVSISNDNIIYTQLSGPNNPANNFFQSQINDDNGNLSTTGTFGNRNFPLGVVQPAMRAVWDKTAISIDDYLNNAQTSAYLRFTSDNVGTTTDNYYVETIGLQIDLLSATLLPTKTASSNVAFIGDVLTYTIEFTNTGTTAANNVTVTDLLDPTTQYVPGSLTANVLFSGDPTGFITLSNPVAAGATVTLTFQVLVTALPANPLTNIARISYGYNITPILFLQEIRFSNIVNITVFESRGIEFI